MRYQFSMFSGVHSTIKLVAKDYVLQVAGCREEVWGNKYLLVLICPFSIHNI